jgi:anti-sigma-K factor RskA
MNYQSDHIKNSLAAEYVLGTLRGLARQRFQKLIMQYPAISDATQGWEQNLNHLGQKILPVTPDVLVWQRIEQDLGFNKESVNSNVVKINKLQSKPKRQPKIWQGIAGLASAAALILAVLLVNVAPSTVPDVQQLALINNEQDDLLWALEISENSIDIQATKALVDRANADYELWMVATDGRAPFSLGLLPKNGKLTLTKPELFDQIDIAALAVSLEPLGGSPNGSPTEVLFTTKLVVL